MGKRGVAEVGVETGGRVEMGREVGGVEVRGGACGDTLPLDDVKTPPLLSWDNNNDVM